MLSGSPLPVGAGLGRDCSTPSSAPSTRPTATPRRCPAEAPGVDPLLIAGGLACLLLVDLLACTLRRVPLAGLPLLPSTACR